MNCVFQSRIFLNGKKEIIEANNYISHTYFGFFGKNK